MSSMFCVKSLHAGRSCQHVYSVDHWQPGACERKRAEVDPKVVNAWHVQIKDDVDDANRLATEEPEFVYTWSIDRPRPSFLVPASEQMRADSLSSHDNVHVDFKRKTSSAHTVRPRATHVHRAGSDDGVLSGVAVLKQHRRGALGQPITFVVSSPCAGPSCMLVLDRGAMIAGQRYLFHLTITERSSGRQQHASLLVPVLTPPSSGSVAVSPQEGVALETRFELRADGWATEAENLPLGYAFYAVNWNRGNQVLIGSQITTSTVLPLPAGDPTNGDMLRLRVRVFDSNGVYALASGVAAVALPPVGDSAVAGRRTSEDEDMTIQEVFDMCNIVEEHLETQLAEAILDANVHLAHHLISSLAAMLAATSTRDPCRHATTFKQVPEECVNLLVRRQGLRFRLLFNLEKANETQTITPSAIEGQASALAAITENPMEMDLNLKLFAVRFTLEAIASVRTHPLVGTETITQTYGQVLHNIIASMKAENPDLYVGTEVRCTNHCVHVVISCCWPSVYKFARQLDTITSCHIQLPCFFLRDFASFFQKVIFGCVSSRSVVRASSLETRRHQQNGMRSGGLLNNSALEGKQKLRAGGKQELSRPPKRRFSWMDSRGA